MVFAIFFLQGLIRSYVMFPFLVPRIISNMPDGRDELDPSTESLRELVFRGGDEFWAWGSGQAALEFIGVERGSRLLLMGLEAAGFFLNRKSGNRGKSGTVSIFNVEIAHCPRFPDFPDFPF